MTLEDGSGRKTEIDVPMAQAMRSKEPLEVGEMTQMLVRVDGVTIHNRTLKVELEHQLGKYITAEVRDPTFDTAPNIYTDSLGEFLMIDAKPTYRDGELVKLHIMNAVLDKRAA